MTKFAVFEAGGKNPILLCELTQNGEVIFVGEDTKLIKNLREGSITGHDHRALTPEDGKGYFDLLPNHLLTMQLIVRKLKE